MSSKQLCSRSRRSARIAAACSVAVKSNEDEGHSDNKIVATPSSNQVECAAPATQSQSFTILTLNDDCLLEIFEHLKVSDLFAITDTCQRFRQLAYRRVEKVFRKDDYVYLPKRKTVPTLIAGTIRKWDRIVPLYEESALTLAKFGKVFTRLSIEGDYFYGFIRFCNGHENGLNFATAMQNCSVLKCLRFKKLVLQEIPVPKLNKVFRNIEILEVLGCRATTRKLIGMLKGTKKLKHLNLQTYITTDTDLLITDLCTDLCLAIIEYGKTLESLRLLSSICNIKTTEFVKFLNQLRELKNLKILRFKYFTDFRINVSHIDILAKSDSLEELHFGHCLADEEFFKALDNISNLKSCKFTTEINITEAVTVHATHFDITTVRNPFSLVRQMEH